MFSAETWSALGQNIVLSMPRFFIGIGVFLLFWLAAEAVRRIVVRVGRVRKVDRDLARFLGRTARVTILVFGVVTGLGTMGVNVTAMVAGLGLTGFALGFALKDIISNMLADVLIIVYKPFQRNDTIKIKAYEGLVEQIDLRYTVLSTEGKQIFVPNSILFTDAITVEKANQPPAESEPEEPTPGEPAGSN